MPAQQIITVEYDYLIPSRAPELARMVHEKFVAGLSLAKGTVLGRVTASGKLTAYASANEDGSQVPVGFLRQAIQTDSSGNVTYTDGSDSNTPMDPLGVKEDTAPYYYQGTFRTTDLVGLDADGLAAMPGARIVVGALANGEIKMKQNQTEVLAKWRQY